MTTEYEINFLQGNTGGAIYSPSHLINIVGTGSIAVSGDQSTGTLTISSAGTPEPTWQSINTNTSLSVNAGYFCVGGSNLQLLLPVVSSIGDTIEVALIGSTAFTITQNASQFIKLGNLQTTSGIGGSMISTSQGDFLRLVCYITNLSWLVIDSVGNLIII